MKQGGNYREGTGRSTYRRNREVNNRRNREVNNRRNREVKIGATGRSTIEEKWRSIIEGTESQKNIGIQRRY